MKRSLALAITVLALTAVVEPLFAAESETAAPVERAAPPSARRAQPAGAQRAAPQRQAPQRQATQSQQSQTSSYTGTQAGGFGGGNAGGGGFADPGSSACFSARGFPVQPNICSSRTPFNESLRGPTGGFGGASVEHKIPVAPVANTALGPVWLVVGVMGDFTGGKTTATSTQTFTYPSEPLLNPAILTTETYRNSVSQGTSGSARLKVGVVVPVAGLWGSVMPYATIGWIRSRIDGNFSYASSSYAIPSCAFNPTCSVMAVSGVNWSQSRNGVVTGIGVEIPIGFGPGVVLVADWTYANFGSFDVPLQFAAVTSGTGTPCVPSAGTVCGASDVAHISNLSSNRFSLGAKFKLF